ncbi:carotenoid ester lipase precursor [Gautieria morchelliformis]|nr:carotenoid ester lipase precursor [Gautieria morchelliformis]
MQPLLVPVFWGLLSAHSAIVYATRQPSGPTVTLSSGTFQGSSANGVDSFLGIRFAQAERFGLPRAPAKVKGIQQATSFGLACPQQSTPPPSGFSTSPPLNTSEDCLFINVRKPSNISPGTKLPVLFWIYGGGFEDGDTSTQDGSPVVTRSIALGEPVIYVSANYRVSALGFSGSKEIKDAGLGNLGLRDQRAALHWVQDNIVHFGGDKQKVTIWGESAGAISVGLQMVVDEGDPKGLFRGAVMESGSPLALRDISTGQPFFDQLVANTGCSGSAHVLDCLRGVSFATMQAAIDASPNIMSFMSLQLAWLPLVDGTFITRDPQDSVASGAFAKIPLVTGDCDDEGTLFSFAQVNLTTDQEGADYLHRNYFPAASDAQFQPLALLPFDTGTANQLSPQFKRIAAFQGDLVFQAPRRTFLQAASQTQNAWAFLFKRGKSTPFLGAFHGSDLPEFYASGVAPDFQGTDALVNFANNLNPNNVAGKNEISTLIPWPMWNTSATSPPLLTFSDANVLSITPDTFRAEGMQALTKLSRLFP